jgi:hypothetical protein
MDYARVAVGTTSIGSLGLRDQFTLAGRYYSTWKELRCDAFGSGAVANITSDTSHVCGDYSFDMNSSGQITASTSVALPYFGRIGITTIAVANAATVRTWTRYVDKTLNPVMETSVKIPQATSTTMYLVGFYGANAGTATPQYLPTQGGAFFVATSTNTWIAITATSPTSQTYTNTNVATSTSLQKMRVELTSTQATFLINDNVVATSNTNLPTAQLSPAIELAITSGSGTYSVFFDISYIKTWSDDPPGDRVVAADDSTPDQTNDSFIYSGNYYTELANSSFPGDYWKVTNVFATGTDPGGLSFYNGTHSFGSLKLSNAGNVGIGTSSPYAKLSVAGTVVADDNIVAPNFVAASTTVASGFAGGINITGGCLAINGVCINTNNILATPSASSTDQSIISLGFSWVLDQLKGIGVTIADGIVSAKEFIAEKVTAKKVVTDSFEMKTPSGVTYCVKLNDAGEFEKTQGACADQPISNGSSATETSVTLDPATTTTPAETSSSTADLAPATDTPPAT